MSIYIYPNFLILIMLIMNLKESDFKVCHGSGNTEEAAHEDAARNALVLLCKIWMVY